MTEAPVPLAEQIAFVERDARKLAAYYATGGHAAHYFEHDLACVRAVLATLQQHERAMAVIEAARRVVDTAKDDPLRIYNATYALGLALAALDDAASAAEDAG